MVKLEEANLDQVLDRLAELQEQEIPDTPPSCLGEASFDDFLDEIMSRQLAKNRAFYFGYEDEEGDWQDCFLGDITVRGAVEKLLLKIKAKWQNDVEMEIWGEVEDYEEDDDD